jgi:hypothetical protein
VAVTPVPCLGAVVLQLRRFSSLFTGEYIYKKLKWEWEANRGVVDEE